MYISDMCICVPSLCTFFKLFMIKPANQFSFSMLYKVKIFSCLVVSQSDEISELRALF